MTIGAATTPVILRTGMMYGPGILMIEGARWLLRGQRTKHAMRSFLALRSAWSLRRDSLDPKGAREYWQAGRSVSGISGIEPAGDIVRAWAAAARSAR